MRIETQKRKNQCETLSGLAHYIDLGMGYKGYLEGPRNTKIYVEMGQRPSFMINNLLPNTLLAVHTELGRPLLHLTLEQKKDPFDSPFFRKDKKEDKFLKMRTNFVSASSFGMGATELGIRGYRETDVFFNRKGLYKLPYFKTYKVMAFLNRATPYAFFITAFSDGLSMYEGHISEKKMFVNTVINALGASGMILPYLGINPVFGTVFLVGAVLYAILDYYGVWDEAFREYREATAEEKEMFFPKREPSFKIINPSLEMPKDATLLELYKPK